MIDIGCAAIVRWAPMEFDSWILSGQRYRDQQAWLQDQVGNKPWLTLFLQDNPKEPRCGSLNSPFRLEPIPFDECFVDRFFFLSKVKSDDLLGAGLGVRINWDGNDDTLPLGWQDCVRRAYRDCSDPDGEGCSTFVPLLAFTLSHHRNKGLSGRFLDQFGGFARNLGHRAMALPTLPPTQFTREGAAMPFLELVDQVREDGLPADHWVRLHVRKGARVVRPYPRSHRFALSVADFRRHISSDPVESSGEHLVRLDRDTSFGVNSRETWQKVHVDQERDLVSFDWGCVWVVYDLDEVA